MDQQEPSQKLASLVNVRRFFEGLVRLQTDDEAMADGKYEHHPDEDAEVDDGVRYEIQLGLVGKQWKPKGRGEGPAEGMVAA